MADNPAKTNSVLKILIEKVCQKAMFQVFKTKIWKLNQALAKAKTRGGNGVKKVFAQWTSGKYSTYTFKIYYNELDYARLQNDNNDLKGQKRKLEDDLKEESCKKAKIEKKLKESVAKNQEITCKFQKKFKRLVQGLLKEALPKIKPFQITTKGINLELEDN